MITLLECSKYNHHNIHLDGVHIDKGEHFILSRRSIVKRTSFLGYTFVSLFTLTCSTFDILK